MISQLEIIYVSPFSLPKEIISYFYKIFELGELQNFKDRIHFIWPENAGKFPSSCPTCRLLYYSPLALNRIKELIAGREAYIVPGVASLELNLIAQHIGAPIFQGNSAMVALANKKSYQKHVFLECDLPVAPWQEEFENEQDVFNKLTVLIAKFPQVKTWLFKIDHEFGGRGIAKF